MTGKNDLGKIMRKIIRIVLNFIRKDQEFN